MFLHLSSLLLSLAVRGRERVHGPLPRPVRAGPHAVDRSGGGERCRQVVWSAGAAQRSHHW